MAAPTSKDRIRDAQSLFAYGFANTAIYQDKTTEKILQIPVKKGVADTLHAVAKQDFSYLDQKKADLNQITSKQNLPENLTAPIKKGDTVGSIDYYLGDKQIGSILVVAKESIAAAGYGDIYRKCSAITALYPRVSAGKWCPSCHHRPYAPASPDS